MAGEEKAENIQRELFRNLSGDITDEELKKIQQELKQKALGGFKAGEIQRELKTTDDILEKLKRRGLIKIGEYGILRKLFEAIGSRQLLEYVDEAENALIAIRWPVKRSDPDPPQRVLLPVSMVYDTHGMHPQHNPHPGGMINPPPYSNPTHSYPSYQQSQMGPPHQPAPHPQHRLQYPNQERVIHVPPQMAPPHPQQHPQYVDGRSGALQQPQLHQYSTSIADVQQRGGPMSSHTGDDVFLTNNNIPVDNQIEYKPGGGYVLFINNFFTGQKDQRHGADRDQEHVDDLFNTVLDGYFHLYIKDATKVKLLGYLATLKKTLDTDVYQSFIFILGTHGEPRRDGNGGPSKDAVLMACGEWILVEDIISNFYGDQIPKMKDKPKVFIIQSCRGKESQRAVSLSDSPATVSNPETPNYSLPALTTRPVNSDILIAYATSEGTKAWRNQEEGSWFVYDLCDVIRHYYNKEHILDILVRVNSRMVVREATVNCAKQMPCFTCTFTKRFMLVPSTLPGSNV